MSDSTCSVEATDVAANSSMPVVLSARSATLVVAYLAAMAVAEVLTALGSPLFGIVMHVGILLALVGQASLDGESMLHRFYLALSLAPLIRIFSLAMPLIKMPVLYWYAIIAVPILIATVLAVRLIGYSWSDVGLTPRGLPAQALIGIIGLPLGVVEYVILKPEPLARSAAWGDLWLAALVLIVGAGLVEELVFRGVLQKAALENMRGWGIIYVSTLFAIFHVGYCSLVELLFVFLVGLLLAVLVRRTGSIVGATLAQGLLNCTLFLFVPLWGLSILPLQATQLPDITFSSGLAVRPGHLGWSTPSWALTLPFLAQNPADISTGIATPTPGRWSETLAGSNPTPTPALPSDSQSRPAEPIVHVVESGDTLSSIAERYGTTVDVLRDRNPNIDAEQIAVGQRLLVPAALHTVAPGETLWQIAELYGTTAERIADLSSLEDPNLIYAGQELVVPLGTGE